VVVVLQQLVVPVLAALRKYFCSRISAFVKSIGHKRFWFVHRGNTGWPLKYRNWSSTSTFLLFPWK
jgi:hypothetical protein